MEEPIETPNELIECEEPYTFTPDSFNYNRFGMYD